MTNSLWLSSIAMPGTTHLQRLDIRSASASETAVISADFVPQENAALTFASLQVLASTCTVLETLVLPLGRPLPGFDLGTLAALPHLANLTATDMPWDDHALSGLSRLTMPTSLSQLMFTLFLDDRHDWEITIPSILVHLRFLKIAVDSEWDLDDLIFVPCNKVSLFPALEELKVMVLRSDCTALTECTSLARMNCLVLDITDISAPAQPLAYVTQLRFEELRGSMNRALRLFPSLERLACPSSYLGDAKSEFYTRLLDAPPHGFGTKLVLE